MPRMNSLAPNVGRLGGLHEPSPLRGPRRLPWWLVPLVLAALVAGSLAAWDLAHRPADIGDVALVGPRSPAALDVVLLLDESGSFTEYADVRAEAITQLADWAPQNLRADDTITIIAFADTAVTRLPPTTVGQIAAGGYALDEVTDAGGGTEILPALSAARGALPSPRVSTVIAVTDTQVSDLDAGVITGDLAALHAMTASLITPTGVGVEPEWRKVLGWAKELVADPGSAGSTSLALAEALAHATGQRVERQP